ncbi:MULTISPECIES: shikimate kinase [Metabacillus]|jgi:shikimate kinase|uniref:Shikimate kinase n=1 Tax=Metabacillus rhizolycopersici TaxID=2875709 RepID=A0ABS7UW69_9BACI|nr:MULTISPECIES: shikimate kinase [Metabacillus]MBZ5752556.1 shikimate kinase [Metabacillus rhizolycopersici]MCM3651657.1 shikimate kinase [Metabacillus litoralis]
MRNKMSLREKSIVFIGFMGVGKTTIGERVAKKLYRDFVDIDKEIEKEYNMPTSEIFKTVGEKVFREKEKSMISDYSQQSLKIISVGGGAFLQEEIRNICLTNCLVFFLDLSWDSWKERISLLIDSRPVLQGKTLEEIETLFYERQEIYSLYHSKIKTDNQEVEDVADFIVESLKTAWEIYD